MNLNRYRKLLIEIGRINGTLQRLFTLALLIYCFILDLKGQVFSGYTPIISITLGSVAMADIDGDNDEDLLISGFGVIEHFNTKLYINDGYGNFRLDKDAVFEGKRKGKVSFVDIDSDDDPDIIITGQNEADSYSTIIYINDGNGKFSKNENSQFIDGTTLAFGDVDGDNDQDILISGVEYKTKLYTNMGNGLFKESTESNFKGTNGGTINFIDVDGDDDLDVLISGSNLGFNNKLKLYINDGKGVYTEDVRTNFVSISQESLAFNDIDNDGDQDLLVSGLSQNEIISKLYLNDGSGLFVESNNNNIVGLRNGTIDFFDFDNDQDFDILMTGLNIDNIKISVIYQKKNIAGEFALLNDTTFVGVDYSNVLFKDIDSDADMDVIITGQNNQGSSTTNYYLNDGNSTYIKAPKSELKGVSDGSISFADIDGDGDVDLCISGNNFNNTGNTTLYKNDSKGHFQLINVIKLLQGSKSAFGDIDNDGDPDLCIIGYDSLLTVKTIIYINDGMGNFTESPEVLLDGYGNGNLAFVDIDGDDNLDLFLTGRNNSGTLSSCIYMNNGTGNFNKLNDIDIPGIFNGSIAFDDVDGDKDKDLVISGMDAIGGPFSLITNLYENDGHGNFTLNNNTIFEPLRENNITFGDVDNDGDMDLLISGYNYSTPITKLYINNGLGIFEEDIEFPNINQSNSAAAFADVDNDSDIDLIISGHDKEYGQLTTMFINDGVGRFVVLENTPFDDFQNGSIAFADFDGDNDQDVLLTGYGTAFAFAALPYFNLGTYSNTTNWVHTNLINNSPFPNPSLQSHIQYKYISERSEYVELIIFNVEGRFISKHLEFVDMGEQTLQINTNHLERGQYILSISSGSKQTTTTFIVL